MTAQARIELFIYPKVAETEDQVTALATAVTYQTAFETAQAAAMGGASIPVGISQFSVGGFSATLKPGAGGFEASISPDAFEVLRKHDLLPQRFPEARRLT